MCGLNEGREFLNLCLTVLSIVAEGATGRVGSFGLFVPGGWRIRVFLVTRGRAVTENGTMGSFGLAVLGGWRKGVLLVVLLGAERKSLLTGVVFGVLGGLGGLAILSGSIESEDKPKSGVRGSSPSPNSDASGDPRGEK